MKNRLHTYSKLYEIFLNNFYGTVMEKNFPCCTISLTLSSLLQMEKSLLLLISYIIER